MAQLRIILCEKVSANSTLCLVLGMRYYLTFNKHTTFQPLNTALSRYLYPYSTVGLKYQKCLLAYERRSFKAPHALNYNSPFQMVGIICHQFLK